ncbi:MAG: hypothetical protein ACMXYM_01655 [Candidatus Woesearchaeota archaeon]
MSAELLTGLATGAAATNSIIAALRIIFVLLGFIFIATCWYFIARRTDTKGAWLAFIPVIGMIVPWRVAKMPLWTLIAAMIAVVVIPIGIVTMIVSIVLILGPYAEEPLVIEGLSMSAVIGIATVSTLLTIAAWAVQMIVTGWWNARAAQEMGFGLWVGLLASPLTSLIPSLGFIVRLVFVGLLAFKKEPI